MIRAKLEGRKTQTRRIMKVQPDNDCYFEMHLHLARTGRFGCIIDYNQGNENPFVPCPYGKVGDVLWRKYCTVDSDGYTHFDKEIIEFAADNPPMILLMDGDGRVMENKDGSEKYVPWRPSIHQPKSISRIWELITNIRVERLQDISPGDACDEGIEYSNVEAEAFRGGELQADFMNYTWRDDPEYEDYHFPMFANPIDSYRTLWESINGEGSWNANPWVWVIQSEILSTTGRPKELSDELILNTPER